MRHIRGLFATWLVLMLSTVGICGAAPPEGQMTWGLHFSPTPGWFDPSELAGTVTSYPHPLRAARRHDSAEPGPAHVAVVAPIWQNVPLNGVGPRVEESGIGLVVGYIFSAPYEDVRLRASDGLHLSSPTATSASASSTGARASGSRRRSTSPPR
jgi:hypothetical protein